MSDTTGTITLTEHQARVRRGVHQFTLDWDGSVRLPVSGRTPQARHASATGAQAAAKNRSERMARYRRLLVEHGPITDHEAARLLGCGLSSINSLRAGFGACVVPSGEFETVVHSTRTTRRVRWRWTC